MSSDVAFIEVNGVRILDWTEYSMDSDLMTAADGFSFSVAMPREEEARRAELREALAVGSEVTFYVGRNVQNGSPQNRYQQMVGIIDDLRVDVTKDGGTVFGIEGRDLAGVLTDASVELDIDVRSNMRLVDLVRAAVDPYDIEVVTDSFAARRTLQAGRHPQNERARSAGVGASSYSLTAQAEADRTGRPIDEVTGNFVSDAISDIQIRRASRTGYANVMGPGDVERLLIRDARPQVGETVWAFCARHCERLGVLMWFSPLGRLILSSPRYTQEPRYRAVRRYNSTASDPNNILTGGLAESIGDRHSEVKVYGRGNIRSSERQPVTGVATDDSWPSARSKPLYMQESSIRSSTEAARKALRELMTNKKDAYLLTYTLPDHGQNGYLFAVDSTIAVIDEPAGVEGTFYITKRTFQQDRSGGTMTSIRAVPLGSLVF